MPEAATTTTQNWGDAFFDFLGKGVDVYGDIMEIRTTGGNPLGSVYPYGQYNPEHPNVTGENATNNPNTGAAATVSKANVGILVGVGLLAIVLLVRK